MGAREYIQSSIDYSAEFSKDLEDRGVKSSTPKPIVSGKELSTYSSRSVAPTLNPYLLLGATIAKPIIDSTVPFIQQMYYDRMTPEQLANLGVHSATTSKEKATLPTPNAIGDIDNINLLDSGYKTKENNALTPQDNLLSVLKQSSGNIENVSIAIIQSNSYVAEQIALQTSQIQLSSEIDVAYKEIQLQETAIANHYLNLLVTSLDSINKNSISNNEINQAYNDTNTENNINLLTAIESMTDKLGSLSSGIKISRSVEETSLISKKLEHINFQLSQN
jgi:hypothetical protein